MKKTMMATAILMSVMGTAMAETTPQELIHKISQVPGKLQNHISMEIVKTKELQKQKWAESKIQFANLKKLFIKDQ